MAMFYTTYYFVITRIIFVNIQMAVNIDGFSIYYNAYTKKLMKERNLT